MAERKPGPVKPPTIDLTARPAASVPDPEAEVPTQEAAAPEPQAETPAKPRARRSAGQKASAPDERTEDTTSAESVTPEPAPVEDVTPPEPPTPPPPQPPMPPPYRDDLFDEPPRRQVLGWSALVTAIIAGALVGTALTYALASFIPLRASGPVIVDPTEQLAAQDARLQTLEENSQAVEEGVMDTQVALEARIAKLDAGLAELQDSLAALRAEIPAPTDLGDVETRLRALAGRVDAIAAGASSDDAAALAQDLAAMADTLPTLDARLDALEKSTAAATASLAEMQAALVEPELPPPLPADVVTAAAALDRAIGAGRPYSAELKALQAAGPDLAVPPAVIARAPIGLPDPEALSQRFAARVPDILSARRPDAGAGWEDTAGDWLKALLAWRPAEEVEGAEPEAVMSRLEAAMARRDFVEAAPLFGLLPPQMQAAASDVQADVVLWAEAEGLLASLRAAAAVGVAQ